MSLPRRTGPNLRWLALAFSLVLVAASGGGPKTEFISVEKGVKLEVLDWGGSGRPVVLLAGLGSTAHDFDDVAPKMRLKYHVYAITRRGFDKSSKPVPENGNYAADRLGDDVLAVMDALKLAKPVLIGHSIAGEELSSVGSRFPNKVAGLVYLDAGFPYAYYNRKLQGGDYEVDRAVAYRKLLMAPHVAPKDQLRLINELLQDDLPELERQLRDRKQDLLTMPTPKADQGTAPPVPPGSQYPFAIEAGLQKYAKIPVPILAIFAVPHFMGQRFANEPALRKWFAAWELKRSTKDADAFERGVPTAWVVRLKNAQHWVFATHEAEVLRDIDVFISGLP